MNWSVIVCQTDDDTELTSEHNDQGEAGLLHSAALHAELPAALISREAVQLETPDYDSTAGDATAASTDVVGLETMSGAEQMSDQGMYVYVCSSVYIVSFLLLLNIKKLLFL